MLTPNEASQLDRWLTREPDYYGPSTQIEDDDTVTDNEEQEDDD